MPPGQPDVERPKNDAELVPEKCSEAAGIAVDESSKDHWQGASVAFQQDGGQ